MLEDEYPGIEREDIKEKSPFIDDLNNLLIEASGYFEQKIAESINNVDRRVFATRLKYVVDQLGKFDFSEQSITSGRPNNEDLAIFYSELAHAQTAPEDIFSNNREINPELVDDSECIEMTNRFKELIHKIDEKVKDATPHFGL